MCVCVTVINPVCAALVSCADVTHAWFCALCWSLNISVATGSHHPAWFYFLFWKANCVYVQWNVPFIETCHGQYFSFASSVTTLGRIQREWNQISVWVAENLGQMWAVQAKIFETFTRQLYAHNKLYGNIEGKKKGTKTILQYVDICTDTLLVSPSSLGSKKLRLGYGDILYRHNSASTLKATDSVYRSALRFITPVQIINLGEVPLTFLLYILGAFQQALQLNALASIGHFKSIIASYSTSGCICCLVVCIRWTIFSLYVLIMHVYTQVYTWLWLRERVLLTSISTWLCSGHTLRSPVTQKDGQS